MSADRQPRVLILNDLGPDLGTQATFAGFLRLLGAATDELQLDVTLDQERLDGLPLRQSTIETINRSYDLVIVAGGTPFADAPSTESGWALDIPQDLAASLEVPIALFAIGADVAPFGPDSLLERRGDVRAITRLATRVTARDLGSARRLSQEFGAGPIDVTPDFALAVEPGRLTLPKLDAARRPIGVTFRLEDAHERFPFPFEARFGTFVETLIVALSRLVEEQGRQVVLVPHVLTDTDVELGRLFEARLPAGSVVQLRDEAPLLYDGPSLDNPSLLAAIYGQLDVVFTQRIAGALLPFVAGTPAVSVSSSPALLWVQEDLGALPEHHIDLRTFSTEVQPDRFAHALDDASTRRDSWAIPARVRREAFVDTTRAALRDLFRDLFVSAGRAPAIARPVELR